jgi:hypothetical protein
MEVDSDSGIDYYPPILTAAKKKGRRRIIEEEDEENSIKIQKEMERMEIFKQLVAELDDSIERAFCNYYKSTLEEFKKFLDTPTKGLFFILANIGIWKLINSGELTKC